MRSSSESFAATSTATSMGRPMTIRLSSSATPLKKKKKCARSMPPMPKLHLLLLQGPWPQPPPPPTLMKHPQGCKMIVMVIAPPIGKLMVAATVETKSAHLRLPHQGGTCKEACFKEIWHDSALLHHNFYKEWW
jgi:hypothetical protein